MSRSESSGGRGFGLLLISILIGLGVFWGFLIIAKVYFGMSVPLL
jgi:hypothetical protein